MEYQNKIILIARERILTGHYVLKLWNRFCRDVKKCDKYIFGVACNDAKKGDEVDVVKLD